MNAPPDSSRNQRFDASSAGASMRSHSAPSPSANGCLTIGFSGNAPASSCSTVARPVASTA